MGLCCSRGDAGAGGVGVRGVARRGWVGRIGEAVEWAAPVVALALIPKCPGCVAAYVLLFTGIGVSFSTAETMRWGLIAACVGALAYLAVRAVRRWLRG